MNPLAAGFWGAFFGAAALALLGALLAFRRSARQVALTGSLAALMSAAYTVAFLGWLPVTDARILSRIQATTAIATAAILALLLFALLGTFRDRAQRHRIGVTVAVAASFAGVAVLLMPVPQGLWLAVSLVALMALAGFAASVVSAGRGERAGWLALAALPCVCAGVAGLTWYAIDPPGTPWQVHAVSASGGVVYLVCIATAMWTRYAYLIEVSKVMTHGPNFDPVTSMPALDMGGTLAPALVPASGRPYAVIVLSIENLQVLQELHGPAAYNHALFITASRLRRMSLPGAELARLREDGFLVLMRHPPEPQEMIRITRAVYKRLSRPVVLGTSRELKNLEASQDVWEASVGVGLLLASSGEAPEIAIAGARAMSRTALSFSTHMAWYDEAAETIAELPAAD